MPSRHVAGMVWNISTQTYFRRIRIHNGFKLHKFASEALWGLRRPGRCPRPRRPPEPPAWEYGLEYFCHYIPACAIIILYLQYVFTCAILIECLATRYWYWWRLRYDWIRAKSLHAVNLSFLQFMLFNPELIMLSWKKTVTICYNIKLVSYYYNML